MKTIILNLLSIVSCVPILVACNASGGGSPNEPPSIENVHTSVIMEPSDPDDKVDMHLSFQVAVDDPNGKANLDKATITFPAGQSYDIDLSSVVFEGDGTYRFNTYFGMNHVEAIDGNKMIPMTGYRIKILDHGGLAVEQEVALQGFDGATVQPDTYLVHPDDYPVASGGGFVEIEGMHIPTPHSASISGSTVSVDVTIDDDRAYDLTFMFYSSDDVYVGQAFIFGTENLELSGNATYTIPESDIKFEDNYSIESIAKLRVYSGDEGLHQSGDFAKTSQQLGMSDTIAVTQ